MTRTTLAFLREMKSLLDEMKDYAEFLVHGHDHIEHVMPYAQRESRRAKEAFHREMSTGKDARSRDQREFLWRRIEAEDEANARLPLVVEPAYGFQFDDDLYDAFQWLTQVIGLYEEGAMEEDAARRQFDLIRKTRQKTTKRPGVVFSRAFAAKYYY